MSAANHGNFTPAGLALAERVANVLAQHHVDSALIGAAALAVYNYPRSTEDVDLAVGIPPNRLVEMAADLSRHGLQVDVALPDPQDPLGGVLRVSEGKLERVEVVNFDNPPAGGFPALVEAALRDALPVGHDTTLRVVTFAHLIVFKLYAGGYKSKSDVLELLRRNPSVDLHQIRAECGRFRLDRKLDAWLRELHG
ncbi:MAG: hypothetical protein IPK82_42865 [Polyangiaceae bacterium]|nr:hypothetical protein [Polyangiaceae bacterium]